MKSISPLLMALGLQAVPALANDQIVTLGDSLTYAYESEFCFRQTTALGTFGDGFNATRIKNWIEILSHPTYRGPLFELGARNDVVVTLPGSAPFTLYFRQAHNWAIPGLKVDELRRFVSAEATFTDLLGPGNEFSSFGTLLSYSDFNEATEFALSDMENQIQTVAERVVIAIGGNDVKAVYGAIYDTNTPGTFVPDFIADLAAIVTRVQTLNPNIQIVVVNVPHVGITPNVREDYPYDAVKTERVSAVLRDLNSQIASLAALKNIGYADIYTPTVMMINPPPIPNGTERRPCVYGYTFSNDVSTRESSGNSDVFRMWLDGQFSKAFHPSTNGQAMFANEIIDAFNRKYDAGLKPLTAQEIGTLTARPDNIVNLDFASWATSYNRTEVLSTPITSADDSDGDGVPASVEFATGLDPTRKDGHKIKSKVTGGQLELAYPDRVVAKDRYTLGAESSTTLVSPFTPVTSTGPGTDGLMRATIPLAPGGRGFMRLKTVRP